MQIARGGLVVITVLIAGLLAAGYTAYAGAGVYQSLESGRQELVAAQASMKAAAHSADAGPLSAAATAGSIGWQADRILIPLLTALP